MYKKASLKRVGGHVGLPTTKTKSGLQKQKIGKWDPM